MELHIKDRIFIPQLLPQTNTFMEYNLKREILKKIAITEADRELYAIKEEKDKNRIVWDVEKDSEQPLDPGFTNDEIKFLQSACEKLVDTAYPDDFWATVEKIYNATAE